MLFILSGNKLTMEIIIKKYLHSFNWNKHLKLITNQIHYVNIGFKVGFLWDIGNRIEYKLILDILNDLKKHKHISDDVILFILDDNYIIVNSRKLSVICNEPTSITFIDCSESLKLPLLLNGMPNDILQKLRTQLSNTIEYCEMVVDDVCVPTVFGILIGYPVVYWYNTELSNENCLSNIDLIIYQSIQDEDVLIQSFSVPKILHDVPQIQNALREWKIKVQNSNLYLKSFIANLEKAIL